METNDFPSRPAILEGLTGDAFSSLADVFEIHEVDSPFVGLRPFEIQDSPLFFGRREQTDELLQRLHRTRFVAVVGGSGCGKSSLVRAGLIPALQAGFLVADRDIWTTFTMKPGDQPLRNLAATLRQENGDSSSLDDTTAGIRTQGVDVVLDRLQPLILEGNNILLVVDQFEETFRFGLDGDEDRREEAADFVSILLALTQKRGLPIYVVLTMRSDFIGDCDAFQGFAEAMNRSLYLVPRLTRQQRREAIEGPIRMAGAAISLRLLDRLLNESDMASDQLPILQHALMRTWEEWREDEEAYSRQSHEGAISAFGVLGRPLRQPEIGISHYERAGTLGSSLNQHAEEALEGTDLDLARRIFQALTDVDIANRQIRRPARLGVLKRITGGTEEAILEVLRRFQSGGRCFVVWASPEGHPDPLFDLSHESLIRCWKRLGTWVEEEAESAAIYRRLETATARRMRGGDLWRGTDLQQALDWQATHDVRSEWAARVRASEVFRKPTWKRPTFEDVMDFLEKSRAHQDEERQRKEEEKRELFLVQEREARAQELAGHRQTWLRRMGAISVVAVALAMVAGGLVVYLNATKSSLEAANSELENIVVSTRLIQQAKALSTANPQLSTLLAVEALDIAPPNVRATKEPENALRSALSTIGGRGLGSHYRGVSSMAVSPDGRWLVSGGLDGTAQQWDLSSAEPELTTQTLLETVGNGTIHQGAVHIATAPSRIAVGGTGGGIHLVGQNTPLKRGGPDISALAFDASGRHLVAGDRAGSVWLWNLASKGAREVHFEKLHQDPVLAAEISHDGQWLVTISAAERSSGNHDDSRELMVLWQVIDGQRPRPVKLETGVSTVSLRSGRLATGSRSGSVRLWKIGKSGITEVGETHLSAPASIRAIGLSSDGKVIVADESGNLFIWSEGSKIVSFLDQPGPRRVNHLAISPRGHWLVAAYSDGSTLLRHLSLQGSGIVEDERFELHGHSGPVDVFAFSPARSSDLDSHWVFTGGSDGTLRRWDLTAADPSSEAVLHRGRWFSPRVMDISPDRKWLIAGDGNRSDLSFLEGETHESLGELASARVSDDSHWLLTSRGSRPEERSFELRRLVPGRGSIVLESFRDASAAVVSINPADRGDTWLVTGQKADGSVWIRRVRSNGVERNPRLVLQTQRKPIERIIITPDRQYILVATAGIVQIWKLSNREVMFAEEQIGDLKTGISSDSRWLAVADSTNVTKVFDLESPGISYRVKNELAITAMVLTSSGRLILGFDDGTARSYLLNGKTGEPAVERVFEGHDGPIFSFATTRDERLLASGGRDGTARIWNLADSQSSPSIVPAFAGTSPSPGIVDLAFDSNATLLTVGLDGTVRRWSITEPSLREEARKTVGRNMYENDWCQYLSGRYLDSARFFYRATFNDLPLLGRKGVPCAQAPD